MHSRQSLIIFLSNYAKSGIGFITLFFVTRLMGAEAIGVVSYHLGFLGLFSICLDLGISTTHIKHVSENRNPGECVGAYLAIKFSMLAIFSLLIFLYFAFINHNAFSHTALMKDPSILMMLFSYYVLDHLTAILTTTFIGRGEFVKLSAPTLIGRIVKLITVILLGLMGWKARALAVAYLAESCISCAYAIFLFKKTNIPVHKPSRPILFSYFYYTIPLLVIIPVSTFSSNIVPVLIGHFSNVEQVGFYFAIQSLIAIPNAISSSAMTVFFPKISADHTKKNHQQMITSIRKVTRYLSMGITPIAVIFITLSASILKVAYAFDSMYANLTFLFLSITMVIIAVTRPYINFQLGIGKHHRNAIINVISLLIIVAGCTLFVPEHFFSLRTLGLGAAGAGLAQLLAWVVSSCLFSYFSFKELKVSFSGILVKHYLAGLGMFTAIYFCKSFFVFDNFLSNLILIIALSTLGLLTYGFLLIILGELNREDYNYLQTLLNPSKLKSDIIKELK